MPLITAAKNANSSLSFITLRSSTASGRLTEETDIKNASVVPSGIGLPNIITAIGTMPAQLP
jgi:hypothetical protein